jgi:hypothetical protein
MIATLIASVVFVSAPGCSDKKEGTEEGAKPSAAKTAEAPASAALPAETETIALDQGESKIPATIEAPKGSTTFNDTPTAIRVTFGEGEAFWVDVKEGNEFNLDLAELEKGMLENKYGSTNETIDKSENLYVWKMTTDGLESIKFRQIVDLAGKKWVCTTGNYGGYDQAQVDRMIEACKTLKAK